MFLSGLQIYNPYCSDAVALNQWTVYVVLTPSPWRYMLSGSDVFEPRSGSIRSDHIMFYMAVVCTLQRHGWYCFYLGCMRVYVPLLFYIFLVSCFCWACFPHSSLHISLSFLFLFFRSLMLFRYVLYVFSFFAYDSFVCGLILLLLIFPGYLFRILFVFVLCFLLFRVLFSICALLCNFCCQIFLVVWFYISDYILFFFFFFVFIFYFFGCSHRLMCPHMMRFPSSMLSIWLVLLFTIYRSVVVFLLFFILHLIRLYTFTSCFSKTSQCGGC